MMKEMGGIPNCMDYGTGYNIKIDVISAKNKNQEEIDFHCRFYIAGSRREVCLNKAQMVTVGGSNYAMIYDKAIGNGWLMCDVTILDPEQSWPGGVRPVSLKYATGIFIGDKCMPMVNPPMCGFGFASGKFENGYKVKFAKVDDIPDEEGNGGNNGGNNGGSEQPTSEQMMYGVIKTDLTSYSAITDSDVAGFTKEAVVKKTIEMNCVQGDKIAVLLPSGHVATKDDGFGGSVAFDESILGSNGVDVTVGGKPYKAYGEFVLTSGTYKINIV